MASTNPNEIVGESEEAQETTTSQPPSRSASPPFQYRQEPSLRKDKDFSSHAKSGENKLRPATDIINRITWDPSFECSDHIIAFVDRFEGLLEINMGNWKKDTTDEEFIPQHRILFIKHIDGEVVWDRRRRIDKIFMSGNSAFSELTFLM